MRILVAGRQNECEFPLLARLLERLEDAAAALKVHGRRCLADHMDWIELDDGGETALIACFLVDIGPFLDEGATDDAGNWRVEFHLLQSNLGHSCVSPSLLYLGSRDFPLRLRF